MIHFTRKRRGVYKRSRRRIYSKRNHTRNLYNGGGEHLSLPSTDTFNIKKAWVLTLNGSPRISYIKERAKSANMPIELFYGTNAKTIDINTLANLGVSKMLYTSRGKKDKEYRNLGSIACFLSHRSLFTKIINEFSNNLDSYHLIMEDDTDLYSTFRERLLEILKELPSDCDVLYFSKAQIHGDKISPTLTKLRPVAYGNVGNWMVLYKVRTLKDVILPHLHKMYDELDVQIQHLFDRINAYTCDPPCVVQNDNEIKSAIQIIDSDINESTP